MSKKILVVDSTYIGNRPNRERNTIIMSVWVKKYNADVTIITTKSAEEFYRELFDAKALSHITFLKLPWFKDFVPGGAIDLVVEYLKRIIGIFFFYRKQEEGRYDVIYSLTALLPDLIISRTISKRIKKAKLYTVFDNFVKKPSERDGNYLYNSIPYWSYRVSLCLLKKFDVMFAFMVDKNINKLRQMFKSKKPEIIQDVNGVDIQAINQVKVEGYVYDILFIGRLHRDKGIFDLLEVIALVKKSLMNVRVCIIGQAIGDIKDEIQKKIKDLDIESNIRLFNYVTKIEKYRLLKSSNSFCFLSYYESYPVAILEAMACQLKIFAYNLDIFQSYPFTLGDIETFSKGSYVAIASKIVAYLKQEQFKNRKKINLSLIDQTKSAELEYTAF